MKCCELTAGKLKEPLAIQRKTMVPDGMGGQVVTWVTLANIRGDVRPMSGREALHGMQLQASVTHRIYIRYRADITAADRLMMRGQPLQIRSVINLELSDRWLELMCDAGVAT